MQTTTTGVTVGLTVVLGTVNLGFGWCIGSVLLVAGGAVGLCYGLVRVAYHRRRRSAREAPAHPAPAPASIAHPPAPRAVADPTDTAALVEQMLAQGRYALLLRPQLAGNLSDALFQRTLQALEKHMALVPDGEVLLGRTCEEEESSEAPLPPQRVVRVERFFLDRYPVTNREYYEFVAAGGYEQMSLWEEAVWLAVLDMMDRTGSPGPRYWRHGCFLPGEEHYPVVGVSWYEAAACARWLGKRLPSDAEWVKAGSWPVPVCAQTRAQRKYPWGDTMDRTRANLWGAGPNCIVPVDQFAGGVSVGGVYQLIGNVWEWTSGGFRPADHPAGEMLLPTAMKSIRGGAFDTYFDNQATCQFQSGENPLHRRHNIGFRCAVGVCDLQLARPGAAQAKLLPQEPLPTTEEVLA